MSYYYRYQINDEMFTQDAYKVGSDWNAYSTEQLAMVAEDAAKDFYYRHDGWEAEWPCEISVFDLSGNLLGTFIVEQECVPQYNAREKK